MGLVSQHRHNRREEETEHHLFKRVSSDITSVLKRTNEEFVKKRGMKKASTLSTTSTIIKNHKLITILLSNSAKLFSYINFRFHSIHHPIIKSLFSSLIKYNHLLVIIHHHIHYHLSFQSIKGVGTH